MDTSSWKLLSVADFLSRYREQSEPATDTQTALGFDMNSVSVDPCFYSKTDLHVREGLLDGAGSFVPEVLYDFDGDLRTNPGCDMGQKTGSVQLRKRRKILIRKQCARL